jgi:hypothetical protein
MNKTQIMDVIPDKIGPGYIKSPLGDFESVEVFMPADFVDSGWRSSSKSFGKLGGNDKRTRVPASHEQLFDSALRGVETLVATSKNFTRKTPTKRMY